MFNGIVAPIEYGCKSWSQNDRKINESEHIGKEMPEEYMWCEES